MEPRTIRVGHQQTVTEEMRRTGGAKRAPAKEPPEKPPTKKAAKAPKAPTKKTAKPQPVPSGHMLLDRNESAALGRLLRQVGIRPEEHR